MNNTLRKDFVVSSYDVGPDGKARLTAIANYLQETAYYHADSLNVGYRHLAVKQTAWILSRLKIRVHEYPEWDNSVTVETWPRGIEKLFALRDFRVFSESGQLLVEATTCWLMVDMESHRPLRLSNDFIPIELRDDAVFDRTPEKISLPPKMFECKNRKVRYSDLDVVGHVNNVKYIEWCTDALDHLMVLKNGVSDLEINYMSEAKIADEILLSCSEVSEGALVINGRHREGEKECFRAHITFFSSVKET